MMKLKNCQVVNLTVEFSDTMISDRQAIIIAPLIIKRINLKD